MKKIEYKVENIKAKRAEFLTLLNQYGQESWELVYMNVPACIFKRDTTNENKFEYNIIDISAKQADVPEILNQQGTEGWELVFMNLPATIFKRELQTEKVDDKKKTNKKK